MDNAERQADLSPSDTEQPVKVRIPDDADPDDCLIVIKPLDAQMKPHGMGHVWMDGALVPYNPETHKLASEVLDNVDEITEDELETVEETVEDAMYNKDEEGRLDSVNEITKAEDVTFKEEWETLEKRDFNDYSGVLPEDDELTVGDELELDVLRREDRLTTGDELELDGDKEDN